MLIDGLAILASIPSPSSNRIGPLRAYGLMIGLGVLAAIGALLYVMAVLDPTSTPKPSHRAERRRVES